MWIRIVEDVSDGWGESGKPFKQAGLLATSAEARFYFFFPLVCCSSTFGSYFLYT